MKCRCQVPDHVTCILFRVFSCSYNGLKEVSTLKRRKCRKNDTLKFSTNNTNNNQRMRSAGNNDRGSKHFCSIIVLCTSFTWHDSKNMHDQITSDRRSKDVWSNCVLYIPFILSGSPNKCWPHTCDACVITTWRLGLQAPPVAHNYDVINVGF